MSTATATALASAAVVALAEGARTFLRVLAQVHRLPQRSAQSNASPSRASHTTRRTMCFAAATESGAFAAIVSPSRCAASRRSAAGTTSLTRPSSARSGRVDRVAGEEQLHRDARRDQQRKRRAPRHAAPDLRLGDGEARVLGGDAQVAHHGEQEAARVRDAVHGRDRRLRAPRCCARTAGRSPAAEPAASCRPSPSGRRRRRTRCSPAPVSTSTRAAVVGVEARRRVEQARAHALVAARSMPRHGRSSTHATPRTTS